MEQQSSYIHQYSSLVTTASPKRLDTVPPSSWSILNVVIDMMDFGFVAGMGDQTSRVWPAARGHRSIETTEGASTRVRDVARNEIYFPCLSSRT